MKVTLQLAPAARVFVPQVLTVIGKSPAFVPVKTWLVSVIEPDPTLVIVIVPEGTFWPTGTLPKLHEGFEKLRPVTGGAAIPVPVRNTACGLPVASFV